MESPNSTFHVPLHTSTKHFHIGIVNYHTSLVNSIIYKGRCALVFQSTDSSPTNLTKKPPAPSSIIANTTMSCAQSWSSAERLYQYSLKQLISVSFNPTHFKQLISVSVNPTHLIYQHLFWCRFHMWCVYIAKEVLVHFTSLFTLHGWHGVWKTQTRL